MDTKKAISLIRKGNNRFFITVDGEPQEQEFFTDGKEVWFVIEKHIPGIEKDYLFKMFGLSAISGWNTPCRALPIYKV